MTDRKINPLFSCGRSVAVVVWPTRRRAGNMVPLRSRDRNAPRKETWFIVVHNATNSCYPRQLHDAIGRCLIAVPDFRSVQNSPPHALRATNSQTVLQLGEVPKFPASRSFAFFLKHL